jgi:cyclin B
MKRQQMIDADMRNILVDWLVEVHFNFRLIQETLFLTVSLLDRFLALHPVHRSKLQLAGIAAFMIACKYEEIYPPHVKDFVYISEDVFSRSQILSMEQLVLKTLDFNLGQPLHLHFLRRLSKAAENDVSLHAIGKYLIELSLSSYEMVQFLPSQIAAAATFMARDMLKTEPVWDATIEHYAGHSLESLKPCIRALSNVLKGSRARDLQATRSKYKEKKYHEVSRFTVLYTYVPSI